MKGIIVILMSVLALVLSGCGPLRHLTNLDHIVDGVSVDVKAQLKTGSTGPMSVITVKFETSSGQKLCGGTFTATIIPGVAKPVTVGGDISTTSALDFTVPAGVAILRIWITSGGNLHGPYDVNIKDTTIVVSEIYGGC